MKLDTIIRNFILNKGEGAKVPPLKECLKSLNEALQNLETNETLVVLEKHIQKLEEEKFLLENKVKELTQKVNQLELYNTKIRKKK